MKSWRESEKDTETDRSVRCENNKITAKVDEQEKATENTEKLLDSGLVIPL